MITKFSLKDIQKYLGDNPKYTIREIWELMDKPVDWDGVKKRMYRWKSTYNIMDFDRTEDGDYINIVIKSKKVLNKVEKEKQSTILTRYETYNNVLNIVAVRKIIDDPNAKANDKLKAIELQLKCFNKIDDEIAYKYLVELGEIEEDE